MFKIVKNINSILFLTNYKNLLQIERTLYLTNVNQLKKIEKKIDEANKTITFEGIYIDDESKSSNLVDLLTHPSQKPKTSRLKEIFNTDDQDHIKPCPFCLLERENIYVQYTDIPVLRQFLKEDGTVLHRKITGLCKKQQRKLLVLVKQAKHAGLLLSLQPKLIDGSDAPIDQYKRKDHLKYNSYFDSYEIMKRTNKYL